MKKLFFSLLATFTLALTANAQTKFVKMELPSFRQSPAGPSETVIYEGSFKTNSGKTEIGQIKFLVADNDNGLIRLEFSENIIKGLSLKTDFFVNKSAIGEGEEGETLSQCLTRCRIQFTDPETGKKLPGRGECKAACWFGAVKDLIPVLAPLLLK